MYMKFWKFTGALSLIVCMVFPLPAYGLMLGLSTQKLTRDAALIVMGDVEDVASQWTADKKFITTTAVVIVQQVIKGKLVEKKIRVMHMGGQVGDTVMRQSDVMPLNKGEKVLLFLSPEEEFSGGAAFRIEGKAHGKYSIDEDHIARKQGFSYEAAHGQMDITIPLETLTEKIRNYVDEK